MRSWLPRTLLAVALGLTLAAPALAQDRDPDLPNSAAGGIDKDSYLRARAEQVARRRGFDSPDAPAQRMRAVDAQAKRIAQQGPIVDAGSWSAMGPSPVPNGQTFGTANPVSGRVTCIAVHPTNANLVYLGTASGGLYRSSNGGSSWTPLMDNAQSLSIGAIAIDPVTPSTVFVGTGEGNSSLDSFFGVGIYRILNADTSPVVEGPFETRVAGTGSGAGNGHAFQGGAVNAIVVDRVNDNRIFVATTTAVGGINGEFPNSFPETGLYFCETALGASPVFSRVAGVPGGSFASATDLKLDPQNSDVLLVAWEEYGGNQGIWRSTNAGTASVAGNVSPSFTRTYTPSSAVNMKLAVSGTGTTMTVYAGVGTGNGTIQKSTDGGATFPTNITGANGYCTGQCWYDIAIAADPNNALNVIVGGQANGGICRRSTNGGTSFSSPITGLHADVHAIAFAPSNPLTVFHGNDGGIFRSTNGGSSWTSRNTTGLNSIQFMGVAVHPFDPNFTIGGSQDNGTHWFQPGGSWTRNDWGDGGFACIDQNAPDVTNVTMYHTYYNASGSQVGYARVFNTASAGDGTWTFLGNGANDISLGEQPYFYAPLELGPGNPNTIYYGTDRLHRSADNGNTNPVVSQFPIGPISAIGIAPTNDDVRLVGLGNGQVLGTVTGSSTLANMAGPWPARYVSRIVIDRTDANVAYVSLSGYGLGPGAHVWKTTNLLTGTPAWSASGVGLPDVPTDALVIDPLMPQHVYAGTDIGVYESLDGGATWNPFTTGMPVVPVFGLATVGRTLRAATHGRGMWQHSLDAPTATQLALTGVEIVDGRVELNWYSADGAGEHAALYRRHEPGDWARLADLVIAGDGQLHYSDAGVLAGHRYEYAIGLTANGVESFLGETWVDVPEGRGEALTVAPNPAASGFQVTLALGAGDVARVELVDVTGRRVAEQVVRGTGEQQVRFADPGWRPGLYWVRVHRGERTSTKRVSIVK